MLKDSKSRLWTSLESPEGKKLNFITEDNFTQVLELFAVDMLQNNDKVLQRLGLPYFGEWN